MLSFLCILSLFISSIFSNKSFEPQNLKFSHVLASRSSGHEITFLSKKYLSLIESITVYESNNKDFSNYSKKEIKTISEVVDEPINYEEKSILYRKLINADWDYESIDLDEIKNKDVRKSFKKIINKGKNLDYTKKDLIKYLQFNSFVLNLNKIIEKPFSVVELSLVDIENKQIIAQSSLISMNKNGSYFYSGNPWYSSFWFICFCAILIVIGILLLSRFYRKNNDEE